MYSHTVPIVFVPLESLFESLLESLFESLFDGMNDFYAGITHECEPHNVVQIARVFMCVKGIHAFDRYNNPGGQVELLIIGFQDQSELHDTYICTVANKNPVLDF